MNRKECRINDLRCKLWLTHFAGRGLEAAHVNSLAVTSSSQEAFLHISEAGLGAEIYEVASRRHGRAPRARNGKHGHKAKQSKIADIFHELFFLTTLPRGIN